MNDMFRSRKQNTSRPPSMHVDDFMAMEHAKTQDSPPPMRRTGPKVCPIRFLYNLVSLWYKVCQTWKVVHLWPISSDQGGKKCLLIRFGSRICL